MHGRWLKLAIVAAALGAAAWLPTPAAAQWRGPQRERPRFGFWRAMMRAPMLGVRGGEDFDARAGSIGADLRVPVGPRGGLLVVPSGDLFFNGNEGHNWQLNLDGELRPFPVVGLYGGAGGALVHATFDRPEGRDTKVGWNLFAGLQPTLLPVRPFVESRWTFQGDHYRAFRLAAGVDLAFLRHRRYREPPPDGYGPPPRRGRRP